MLSSAAAYYDSCFDATITIKITRRHAYQRPCDDSSRRTSLQRVQPRRHSDRRLYPQRVDCHGQSITRRRCLRRHQRRSQLHVRRPLGSCRTVIVFYSEAGAVVYNLEAKAGRVSSIHPIHGVLALFPSIAARRRVHPSMRCGRRMMMIQINLGDLLLME